MKDSDMKDCDIMESFDRKFEKFRSKDSELEESGNEISKSFDGKFEKFQSKDSELEESGDGVLESFDGKIEKFRSKDTISRNDLMRPRFGPQCVIPCSGSYALISVKKLTL